MYHGKKDNPEAIKILINLGADVNGVDDRGDTPLMQTAHASDDHDAPLQIATTLLACKALVDARNNNGRTALHIACMRGNLPLAKLLLKNGASINAMSNDNYNPLLLACQSNNDELVNFLLENEADYTINNGTSKSPLCLAAKFSQQPTIIKRLIQAGADLESNKKIMLYNAVHQKEYAIVTFLLENNANVNQEYKGKTLLQHACDNSCYVEDVELARLLVKNGANVAAKNTEGKTALHYAVDNTDISILQLLLDHKAPVNEQDNEGKTPLHYAFDYANPHIVDALINAGANPLLADNSGDTPIMIVQKRAAAAESYANKQPWFMLTERLIEYIGKANNCKK